MLFGPGSIGHKHGRMVGYKSPLLLDAMTLRATKAFKSMFAYDERDSEALVNSVYAPEVTINYDTSLLGKGAETMPNTEWAKRLEHLHDRFDTTQHIVQCKVSAYAHGIFYKRDAEGQPTIMARRQGGRYDPGLARLDAKEDLGANPWRIKVQNVRLDWQDKNQH
ncbi:hypothetical protein PG994_005001 [Apiospora phragmitis]|uniref:SnoaL-like domain-containing protein n=1 Tax=Apiospora phragmitis TaxID=2905665 RepID=A0ABR1VSC5_9PEZI